MGQLFLPKCTQPHEDNPYIFPYINPCSQWDRDRTRTPPVTEGKVEISKKHTWYRFLWSDNFGQSSCAEHDERGRDERGHGHLGACYWGATSSVFCSLTYLYTVIDTGIWLIHANNTKKIKYIWQKICIGPRMKRSLCALTITGSSILGMQGMEQAARKSSTWHAAVARSITRVPSSTTASKLLWSSGGSTEWRKMPRAYFWGVGPHTSRRCLAAIGGYARQLVEIACGRFHAERSDSSSARGSGTRRVCANFRVWVLRGLYCLQTTTKNSGHDASPFVKNTFLIVKTYNVPHKIKKKIWENAPSWLTVRFLCAVVLAQ